MKKILPYLPDRPRKPRKHGLTMVMDKGLSLNEAAGFMSIGSNYTDYVKLGFGTSIITPGLEKKINLYKKKGVIPYFGGTLFEVFVIRDMFREFVKFLDKYRIDLVEVSDGSYDIDHDRKLEYIHKLARHRTVISEVGSKKKEVVYSPAQWVEMMKSELDAGSVKVIAEARESGTTGIYNEDGSINNSIIGAISDQVKLENVIWEAPLKSQQAWFIKHFGANVNLGNIAPSEIIPLETLRLGLRGDTFFQFLPEDLK
ncbi:MAG TPA: phosphosulfolactate synthase [Bacteroidales bacterium]|nr:phosphosulfolactate synthase [Bacteroidales bacterium]HPF04023.1 phosphosulfolactate synthase [Bacteroidales bacterium]HPJ59539.1 phosphosulfolactate synthase [Bacteroidales bacterium]HPR12076.1 phosphosulfolactate synthase [Bacteroidales bacterium]HRW86196.1 phosphosulfolactate synthase [Bacteroidales bacterium]